MFREDTYSNICTEDLLCAPSLLKEHFSLLTCTTTTLNEELHLYNVQQKKVELEISLRKFFKGPAFE